MPAVLQAAPPYNMAPGIYHMSEDLEIREREILPLNMQAYMHATLK